MAANVEAMMYAGQVPWHGVGTAVPSEVTTAEAIRLCQLDWDVEVAPIVTNDQKRTAVVHKRVTRRVQDQAILGIVNKGYKPIQNRDAFGMLDTIIGKDTASIHTAGSLEGGSKVFMLAKMPEPLIIGKDQGIEDLVDRYLLLSSAHDGTRPLQCLFTPVRVVCSNTLAIALSNSAKDDKLTCAPRVSIRHNVNAAEAMKQAELAMARAVRYYGKFGDFANFLTTVQVAAKQVELLIEKVFPANDQLVVTKTQKEHREQVERLFVEGKGHDKIAGSAWALLNAFGEYADHGYALRSAKTAEDRSASILMGGAKYIKTRANKAINGFARAV